MTCPQCKLINPPDAQRCDCGYDFGLGKMEGPQSTPSGSHIGAIIAGVVGTLGIIGGILLAAPYFSKQPDELSFGLGLLIVVISSPFVFLGVGLWFNWKLALSIGLVVAAVGFAGLTIFSLTLRHPPTVLLFISSVALCIWGLHRLLGLRKPR